MPKTTGVELVRKIKERHEWSELQLWAKLSMNIEACRKA